MGPNYVNSGVSMVDIMPEVRRIEGAKRWDDVGTRIRRVQSEFGGMLSAGVRQKKKQQLEVRPDPTFNSSTRLHLKECQNVTSRPC